MHLRYILVIFASYYLGIKFIIIFLTGLANGGRIAQFSVCTDLFSNEENMICYLDFL